MRRLYRIFLVFIALGILLVVNALQAQQNGSGPPVQHSELVYPLICVIIFLLGLIGWMLRTWYVELRQWREGMQGQLSRHDKILTTIKTKCNIMHPDFSIEGE